MELEADFGTLCHSIIEDKLGDSIGAYRVPASLRMNLEKGSLASIVGEATRLVADYLASPAAEMLKEADDIKSEVPFLMQYERNGVEAFISGVIDLIVERIDEHIVIDFKTDRLIRGGEYYIQAQIYREAVTQWTTKPVRCFLVYLRNHSIIEIQAEPLPDFFGYYLKLS